MSQDGPYNSDLDLDGMFNAQAQENALFSEIQPVYGH
jgi:hypothetical protein